MTARITRRRTIPAPATPASKAVKGSEEGDSLVGLVAIGGTEDIVTVDVVAATFTGVAVRLDWREVD